MRFEDIHNIAGDATSTILPRTPTVGTSSIPLFDSSVSSEFSGGQPQSQNTFGSSNFPYTNYVF